MSHRKKILVVGVEETCDRPWTLEPCCYEITRASTMAEGLKIARDSYFDLYLVTQCAFESAGIMFCRQVRAFNPFTPILLCAKLSGDCERNEMPGLGYFASSAESWEVEEAIVRLLSKPRTTKQKVAKASQAGGGQAAQASSTLKIA